LEVRRRESHPSAMYSQPLHLFATIESRGLVKQCVRNFQDQFPDKPLDVRDCRVYFKLSAEEVPKLQSTLFERVFMVLYEGSIRETEGPGGTTTRVAVSFPNEQHGDAQRAAPVTTVEFEELDNMRDPKKFWEEQILNDGVGPLSCSCTLDVWSDVRHFLKRRHKQLARDLQNDGPEAAVSSASSTASADEESYTHRCIVKSARAGPWTKRNSHAFGSEVMQHHVRNVVNKHIETRTDRKSRGPIVSLWAGSNDDETCHRAGSCNQEATTGCDFLCGVVLLQRSLASSRGDQAVRGLSPTVSWVMAKLLKLGGVLASGDAANGKVRVLDPMAGNGVTGLEVMRMYARRVDLILNDIDEDQLQGARQNFKKWEEEKPAAPFRFLTLDAASPALADEVSESSVDGVVCDLPFGKNFGSVEGNTTLYPQVLSALARVLKPSRRMVLLTSVANAATMEACAKQMLDQSVVLVCKRPFQLGYKMKVEMYVFCKRDPQAREPSQTEAAMLDKSDMVDIFAGPRWRGLWLADREGLVPVE